jgi:hypothetical protein
MFISDKDFIVRYFKFDRSRYELYLKTQIYVYLGINTWRVKLVGFYLL